MSKRSSNKKAAKRKDAEDESITQNDSLNEVSATGTQDATEDCFDDVNKGSAMVDKMMDAAAAPRLSTNCKCLLRRGKFYCYKLVQGRWTQASAVAYPSKEICEANNCML